MIPPGTTPCTASGVVPPMVQCDLCEAPTQLPPGAIRGGQIIGLIVCTQCTEDALEATVNTGATLALVGASH